MIPYKDDNPTRTFPFVTLGLIAINSLIFLYEVLLGPQTQAFIFELGMIPFEVTHGVNLPVSPSLPPYLTLLTSMFLHGGWLHLIGNMLYLWIFGDNVEDALGHFRFLIFYIVCGLIAAGTHIFSSMDSTIPTVGASGSIAGVLGAYFLLYPRAHVYTLIPIFFYMEVLVLPASIVLGFWFLLQIFNGIFSWGVNLGGVAWFAHIGGFIGGYLLMRCYAPKLR
ncbi:MAG: rhomboid family intramembrane serine protease [Deltaproteobacteria bacterium]|nr:rhomboid family intramembrane serine protease [Deltaproteobacteria bacterium]